MQRPSLLACLAIGLAFTPSTADAQYFQLDDPCAVASFPDEAKRDEYKQLQAKLSYSPQHSAALRERIELSGKFWALNVGNELRSLWNDAYRQVQEAVLAHEMAEVQVVLMDRCLNRLQQSPATETESVRADIEFLRALLALPDDAMAARFKARLRAMLDTFGTAEAANQTLRINLGLAVPH
jgi:hypothetical protein